MPCWPTALHATLGSVIQFDDSRWPLLVIRVDGRPTAGDVEHYMKLHTQLLDGKGRFASIADLTALRVPELGAIKRYTKSASEGDLQALTIASAFVAPTPALRGMLSFVNQLLPPKVPTVVAKTFEQALAHCVEHLEAAGLSVPDAAAAG